MDDALLPDEAILDPSLLAGVPPAVTADTGMDVLTHAAEAYVARGATPYTDALAEKAFTLAWQNLRPAWETAGESGAKGNMLLASNLAGIAFNAAGSIMSITHRSVGLSSPCTASSPPQVAADGVALLLQIFGNQIVENGLVLQNADPHAAHTSLPNCSGA